MKHAYPGPTNTDFDNVTALNAVFLRTQTDLKSPQRGRLANVPFLLFSLREGDADWWSARLAAGAQGDLLASNVADATTQMLQTAAIGFLWQLANRDPHVARLVSGASHRWCDILRQYPLITVLDRTAKRGDLLETRLHTNTPLLQMGTSSISRLRRASHLVALQTLLATSSHAELAPLATAACSMQGPHRTRIAEPEDFRSV